MTAPDLPARVLVVDEDNSYRTALEEALTSEGFTVQLTRRGREALNQFHKKTPDVVVLDLRLPDMSGIALCRIMRENSDVAILVLSATNNEMDVVQCFELGADDYLCKPFRRSELVARINAAMRHHNLRIRDSAEADPDEDVIEIGPIRIDHPARTVEVRGRRVDLALKEFDLLYQLARSHGQVCSREQLMSEVWGADDDADDRTLSVHIYRLRNKLESDPGRPQWILTAQGVGFVLRRPFRNLEPQT